MSVAMVAKCLDGNKPEQHTKKQQTKNVVNSHCFELYPPGGGGYSTNILVWVSR